MHVAVDGGIGQSFACVATVHGCVQKCAAPIWNGRHIELMHSQSVVHTAPKGLPFGWKNFYKEDHPTMTPEQTMAQQPTPVMISYQ